MISHRQFDHARARHRWTRRVALLVLPLLVLVGAVVVGGVSAHAQADPAKGAITGGSNYSNVVLELPQDSTVEDVYAMHVSNMTDATVLAQFQYSAPYGITLNAKQQDFTLTPGKKTSVPFTIAVAGDTPGGEYKITTGIFRQDIQSVQNNVVFVPGVTQTFTVRVLGDAGTAAIRVIDKFRQQPVSGLVTVERVNGSARTTISRKLSDKFSVRAVPGTYEATVYLDGRKVAVKRFSVVKDQTTDVLIEVEAIYIREVALRPEKTNGKLQTIELIATIENSLKPVAQAQLVVDVLRNKKLLETVDIEKFAPLATGSTDASLRYIPKKGWKPGVYTFVVRLEAPEFTVKATTTPSYKVEGPTMSPLGWILGALGLLALIVAIVIGVRRRRRRKDEDARGGSRAPRAPAKARRPVTKVSRG